MEDFKNLGIESSLLEKSVRGFYRVSVREHDLNVLFDVPTFSLIPFIEICIASSHPVMVIGYFDKCYGNKSVSE